MRNVEPVAHLVLELWDQLLAQERGDVVRFDSMDRGAGEVAVDRLQLGLPAKDDVGGELPLVQAPVTPLGLPSIRDALPMCPFGVLDYRVVDQAIVDMALFQLRGRPVVAVEGD